MTDTKTLREQVRSVLSMNIDESRDDGEIDCVVDNAKDSQIIISNLNNLVVALVGSSTGSLTGLWKYLNGAARYDIYPAAIVKEFKDSVSSALTMAAQHGYTGERNGEQGGKT